MSNFKRLLRSARHLEPADLVLKNGKIINVFDGSIEEVDLAVKGGRIVGLGSYNGLEEVDVKGRFLAPGFIDPHLHIESTMLTPPELTRALLPHGTTALIADPHEIANVLGRLGIEYLLDSARSLPLDFFFMLPSCVPATELETSGGRLEADDLARLMDDPLVLGLAEVMNFPGVINGDPDVWRKLELFESRPIDGHAPLLSGPDLSAYLLAGIATDHECTDIDEAREKLARGMYVLIREGTLAKNMRDLLPMVNERNYRRISFCTDDRRPTELLEHGHIDDILRQAVKQGLDPISAVTMATLNPAEMFGLKKRGALAPGYLADIVVLDSLETFEAAAVYKKGRPVAAGGEILVPLPAPSRPEWAGSMNVGELSREAFQVRVPKGRRVRVIELIPDQLLTNQLQVKPSLAQDILIADPERDLALLAVVERHKASGAVGLGLVKGFGLKKGALASSVAHDSHNIVVVGASSSEMHRAVKAVIKMGGGLVVVSGLEVLAEAPLPLAGLISASSLRETAEAEKKINLALDRIDCGLKSPFMALSFLALPVIPHLKLTDQGLVDVDHFEFVSLFIN